nr:WbqC family protein [Streptomyces sparsogenes]
MCVIHQPNLFPRLTTLAKLFAADYWIVLDDVQFTRRDYQHRTRLAALDDPQRHQWLTIPTHLPNGRQTAIRDAVIADPTRSRRRLAQMLPHYYQTSPHWRAFGQLLEPLLGLVTITDKTAQVAEASTRLLLSLLGWSGQIVHSSDLPSRPGRSLRLADLAEATGARGYLCGTGGMKYLETDLFTACGIEVTPFRPPTSGRWQAAREITAVHFLMQLGPEALADQMRAAAHQSEVRPVA